MSPLSKNYVYLIILTKRLKQRFIIDSRKLLNDQILFCLLYIGWSKLFLNVTWTNILANPIFFNLSYIKLLNRLKVLNIFLSSDPEIHFMDFWTLESIYWNILV